jgi:hypothetical protein
VKKLLTTFVEVVLFLFTAFSGFLTRIAPPPETNASFAVGIGSFFMLIILLAISAIAREATAKQLRKKWIKVGILCFVLAFPLGLSYSWVLNKLTYPYPPLPFTAVSQHVNGWELTETAKSFIREHPDKNSPGELEFNLPSTAIWTERSLSAAKMILLCHYTALILVLSTAIFCLVEANIGGVRARRKGSS